MHEDVKLFKAWFVFLVVSSVGGLLAGGVAGAVAGFVMVAAGADPALLRPVCGMAGYLAALPVSYLVFSWAVRRFVLPQLRSPVGGASSAGVAG